MFLCCFIFQYLLETADNLDGLPFKLHDFGFRGSTSVEVRVFCEFYMGAMLYSSYYSGLFFMIWALHIVKFSNCLQTLWIEDHCPVNLTMFTKWSCQIVFANSHRSVYYFIKSKMIYQEFKIYFICVLSVSSPWWGSSSCQFLRNWHCSRNGFSKVCVWPRSFLSPAFFLYFMANIKTSYM